MWFGSLPSVLCEMGRERDEILCMVKGNKERASTSVKPATGKRFSGVLVFSPYMLSCSQPVLLSTTMYMYSLDTIIFTRCTGLS